MNKVWHLDAQLGQIDMYSLGWKAYLHQRAVDEERRRREREVAEKKAERLMQQGIRLHAKATKAVAAQNMMRRAEKLLETTSEAQKQEKVADIRSRSRPVRSHADHGEGRFESLWFRTLCSPA